jgi:hypothetical protein
MSAKKDSPQGRSYRKELEYLYARRSAVDLLIRSLEQYDRFRARNADPPRRKTA